jgi:hypothetical protein
MRCETLAESDLWSTHGTDIWTSPSVTTTSGFYPVYRWGSHYSYAPLPLLLLKRRLSLDAQVAAEAAAPRYRYHSGMRTIDQEIARVGGPAEVDAVPTLCDPETYAQAIAGAMRADIAAAEAHNAGMRHVVMVGGRDSLNLLLAPWREPVLAVSAAPNHPLVAEFVKRNGLRHEVRELEDPRDEDVIEREVLANCCRATLAQMRWGAHLRAIARELSGRLVYWAGQLGDTFMTPFWRSYSQRRGVRADLRGWLAAASRLLPRRVDIAAWRGVEARFRRDLWWRGGMFQAVHLSLIREVSDCLALSGYHGPAMQRVLAAVDLGAAVRTDVRPRVGELLLGAPVWYPTANPSPLASEFRAGLAHPNTFLGLLRRDGFAGA